MLKSIFQLGFLVLLGLTVSLSSCNKEDIPELTDADFYVDNAIYGMQRDASCGSFGCFEFVFPVDVEFPDGSIVSVDSYEDLGTAIRTYIDANPDTDVRPSLVYPVDVMTQDGELATIDDQEALRALASTCAGRFDGRRIRNHRNRRLWCLQLVFPVTIEFEDGSTVSVNDRAELKTAIRTWHADNPDASERPQLTFPLTVEDPDGNQTTVNDREELQDLKQTCQDDDQDP
ncbi:MAG: hypothetical protein AAF598_02915 [Bacteroidota bacterium]